MLPKSFAAYVGKIGQLATGNP